MLSKKYVIVTTLLSLFLPTQLTCTSDVIKDTIYRLFPPYSTETYLYTKTIETLWTEPVEQDLQAIISDMTTKSYFSTGITRKVITQKIHGNKMTRETETWQSQNPSYYTWPSIIAMSAILTIITIMYTLHEQKLLLMTIDEMITYLLTHETYKSETIALLAQKLFDPTLINQKDIAAAIGMVGKEKFKTMIQNVVQTL